MRALLCIASLALGVTLCGCEQETGAERQARQLREIAALPRYPGGPKPDYRTPEQREWAREEAAREADEAISTLLNR